MAKRYFPTSEENTYKSEIIANNTEMDTSPESEKTESDVYGYVTDCSKLNIRTKPISGAEVICTVNLNDKLLIDINRSTENWYCVTTNVGIEGFCMNKYVTVE